MAVDIPGSGLAAHIVQAVQGQLVLSKVQVPAHSSIGFFRSIGLRNENALQDTLRLLTLWFKFGAHDDVSQAMASGFSVVEVDTWLEVIPQVSTDLYWTLLLLKYSLRSLPAFKLQASMCGEISTTFLPKSESITLRLSYIH